MFSLTIVVGPTVWSLLYQTEEKARAHRDAILQGLHAGHGTIVAKDDFGQELEAPVASFQGVLLENLNESKMAHCERMLHQARTQGQAQRMAESDPMLRMGAQMRGAPVLSPMGPNGR